MFSKKSIFLLILIVIIAGSLFIFNYVALQMPMNTVMKDDYRNKGIDISVYYSMYLNPSELVIDVRKIDSSKSPADVFRVFLQYAQEIKDRNFSSVILSSQGNHKFLLHGDYFQKLGAEYEYQNTIYTIRTFPQNVLNVNGSAAFPTWTGGLIGVTSKQMQDFNDFHAQWYLEDLTY